jgi:nitrogen regulatory protein PII 1
MKLIRAIIRPKKVEAVVERLSAEGFHAYTKVDVSGRGEQKGVKVGETHYDELSKTMILIVVEDKDKTKVVDIIAREAKTKRQGSLDAGEIKFKMGVDGVPGDGKIFVSTIEEDYTISSYLGI